MAGCSIGESLRREESYNAPFRLAAPLCDKRACSSSTILFSSFSNRLSRSLNGWYMFGSGFASSTVLAGGG